MTVSAPLPAASQASGRRAALLFAAISGLGWLLDMATFSLLTLIGGVPGAAANMISAFVGVTTVWFVSLRRVFGRAGYARSRYLLVYWVYQFVSISAYSLLIGALAGYVAGWPLGWLAAYGAVLAKVLCTPLNLVTNFLFMRYLTRYMQTQ